MKKTDERAMYCEAVKLVPGLLTTQQAGRKADAAVLLEPFFQGCSVRHISAMEGWSIIARAALHWCGEMVDQVAAKYEMPSEEVLQTMGIEALSWASARE